MDILDENEDKELIRKLLKENRRLLIFGLSLEIIILIMYICG